MRRVLRVDDGHQHAADPAQPVADQHDPAAAPRPHVPDTVWVDGLPRHGRLLLKTAAGPGRQSSCTTMSTGASSSSR
jgi:hypothetical protein